MSPAALAAPRVDRTGASIVDEVGFGYLDDSSTHTKLIYGSVLNPVLRDVLPTWESILSWSSVAAAMRPASPFVAVIADVRAHIVRLSTELIAGHLATWLVAAPSTPETWAAHDAVSHVASTLGMPLKAVLGGTGVAPRTYYSWSAQGVAQPRLASQGSLWKLVQVTDDLTQLLGADLTRWMRADPRHRILLEGGQFDQLLSEALGEQSSTPPVVSHSLSGSVGPEPEVPRLADRGSLDRATVPRRVGVRPAST
jgi:hypothetical protein